MGATNAATELTPTDIANMASRRVEEGIVRIVMLILMTMTSIEMGNGIEEGAPALVYYSYVELGIVETL